MKAYKYTSPPVLGMSVLICPLCGLEVHRTLRTECRSPVEVETEVEECVEAHLLSRHPLRMRAWRALHWKWLIRGLK
jgi:hypothetical protein